MVLETIIREVEQFIWKSGVRIPDGARMVLSHHHGLSKFRTHGAAVVECIMTDWYAKKILVLLPGQYHEAHYHNSKNETFHVLFGEMFIMVDDVGFHMVENELKTVRAGQKHSFSTDFGCVFEEISTAANEGDSVYEKEVSKDRKTFVREY